MARKAHSIVPLTFRRILRLNFLPEKIIANRAARIKKKKNNAYDSGGREKRNIIEPTSDIIRHEITQLTRTSRCIKLTFT